MLRSNVHRVSAFSLFVALTCPSCVQNTATPPTGEDPEVTTRGSIEVTAELVEIPKGAIFKRDLYNYTTILKYRVHKIHRGELGSEVIHVGHYNPFKPRSDAADRRAPEIGGNVKAFEEGQLHRMALEVPIDDFYMGGIVNKYFDENTAPIYWAAWTNLVPE